MPTELREQLNSARGVYRGMTYGGDLAAELLPPRRMAISWSLPVIGGAIAAVLALALWHRSPTPTPEVPPSITKAAPVRTLPRGLLAIREIRYEAYVHDIHSGVKHAVRSLTGTVDIALTAPVVHDSVQKVGEVTDDIKEIASNTWSQFRALPKPPC